MCSKWSDVQCSDVEWTELIYVKWSEVSYGEVPGEKMSCTLGWPYIEGTWFYCAYFIWVTLYYGCFNLFCNVWFCVCGCFAIFGCFGNMCICIYYGYAVCTVLCTVPFMYI